MALRLLIFSKKKTKEAFIYYYLEKKNFYFVNLNEKVYINLKGSFQVSHFITSLVTFEILLLILGC